MTNSIPKHHTIYQVAQTPAIDRLADEGLAFRHGYTVPLCRPPLQAMVTGMFPHTIGDFNVGTVTPAGDSAGEVDNLMNGTYDF